MGREKGVFMPSTKYTSLMENDVEGKGHIPPCLKYVTE
jgi:hypothetical protein